MTGLVWEPHNLTSADGKPNVSFQRSCFFQLHMAIQISIKVCLFAAWTACLRYGSDLFADFLGKMALGYGWAVGRAESLWLQCVWVIVWVREQCSHSLLVSSQDWKEMMRPIISVSTLSLLQHLPAHRMLSGSSRWSSKWPQAFPE